MKRAFPIVDGPRLAAIIGLERVNRMLRQGVFSAPSVEKIPPEQIEHWLRTGYAGWLEDRWQTFNGHSSELKAMTEEELLKRGFVRQPKTRDKRDAPRRKPRPYPEVVAEFLEERACYKERAKRQMPP